MKNYYQILGLEPDATQEEIKEAYRDYAKKFHPDKHNGDEFFKERFQEIQEAYEVLSNQKFREESDDETKSSPKKNHKPTIISFNSNKKEIPVSGDEITFYWDTENSEGILLRIYANGNSNDYYFESNKGFISLHLESQSNIRVVLFAGNNSDQFVEQRSILIHTKFPSNDYTYSMGATPKIFFSIITIIFLIVFLLLLI